MPRGVNPLVARFLAYHKHLLPVRGLKTISDVAAVGIVDTQSRDRLGPAAAWLDRAEHVVVVDHHM
jgi:nanoRNase/pAp phosphatase (c-di-AMP/oligoRNAs hydrolase)